MRVPSQTVSRKTLAYSAILLTTANCCFGLILYSGDNSANQSAPDAAREDIFNSVGRLTNGTGTSPAGSTVHLRGKYLLTANHVINAPFVTFDMVTFYERDTEFTPIQFSDSDMKLIKLVEDPGLPAVQLYTGLTGEVLATATFISWGRGRDPNINDAGTGPTNIWDWGDNNTIEKRWGTNQIVATNPLSYDFQGESYSYTALFTNLDQNAGSNEAGAALYDSGSGLFINDGGTWKLAGITTLVSNGGSSTFSVFGDENYFVRISTYASDIEDQIPDLTTLSGWKIDHSLYDGDADNDADTDNDGIEQLLEFALGGDPNENDNSILPTFDLVEDDGLTYLELTVTRPIGLQDLVYIPQTTTDIGNWPTDSIGIVDDTPTPTNNGDGTETLVYRRSDSVSATDEAFIRLEVSEAP